MRHIVWIFTSCILVSLPRSSAGQSGDVPAVVVGTVMNEAGDPMMFVNVQLQHGFDGASTDALGKFVFKSMEFGQNTIQATMIGYERALTRVQLIQGDTSGVTIVMKEVLISLDEAVVTASAYSTGDAEAVTLESLEVLTTPGAAADILLAIKTFPGVSSVDEGAGLFVRGGDLDETVLLIDQATVAHPFKYESPTGGAFGTIPPFLVGGTFFSSGGFSAKYGNALSGILSMASQNLPSQTTYAINLGLAAASVGVDYPIVPGKVGLRVSGNRSFTGLMMRVNGFADEFSFTPRGTDVNLSLIYQYSSTGRIKVFNYSNYDRVGVFIDQPSFDGVFQGNTNNWLHNIQLTDITHGWLLESSLSLNRYQNHQSLGGLNFRPSDVLAKTRTDAERPIGKKSKIRLGVEYAYLRNTVRGNVPSQANILDPNADFLDIDERYVGSHFGIYSETEIKVTRRLGAQIGIRSDYFGLSESTTADPRISVRYAIDKSTDLRLSWGIYHQISSPFNFNSANGNPNLKPQRAQHFVGGVNYERDMLMMRIEGYYKPYSNLVVEDNEKYFSNTGDGTAYGIDMFVKYGGFLKTRVNGWISYSYLQSDRTQPRYSGSDFDHQFGPSPFDITNNLTIVGKMRLVQFLSAGITYRFATGRPFTPVVDAIADESGSYYLPIEGDVGSERLPDYQRLDATLSYFLPFGSGHNAVFYLAMSNIFDRRNVLDFEYSLDYSERVSRNSFYRNFVYFGLTISLNRIPQ